MSTLTVQNLTVTGILTADITAIDLLTLKVYGGKRSPLGVTTGYNADDTLAEISSIATVLDDYNLVFS